MNVKKHNLNDLVDDSANSLVIGRWEIFEGSDECTVEHVHLTDITASSLTSISTGSTVKCLVKVHIYTFFP